MFFTRTLGAVLLTSVVAGVAYAAPQQTEKTLNVTATIPAMQPKLVLTRTSVDMIFNQSSDTLDSAKTKFTVTGNSGLSIFLEDSPSLTHETTRDAIPLKVFVQSDDLAAEHEIKTDAQHGAYVLRRADASFAATDVLDGTLIIKPANQVHIANTRVGKYAGTINVIVQANETDEVSYL